MKFVFFLLLSMTSLVLGDDVCYKYEPLYNNATDSTAISVVRMMSLEICKLAGQCKVKDQSSENNYSHSYAMCPLPLPQPSPEPTIYQPSRTFYLAPTFDFSLQNQTLNKRFEICPKKDEIYAAMCYVNDDWSNMCPRDQNNATDWSSDRSFSSLMEQPVCYVMKRSIVNRDENGICNDTIAPPKEFCDVINGCEKLSKRAANKSLILFHFDQVENTCFADEVSATKFLAAKQKTCQVLDQHLEAELPTCLRPVKHLNETQIPFSLYRMFNSALQQCVAR